MAVADSSDSVVLEVPTCKMVSDPDVDRAITVVDEPEPTVMVEPSCTVCEPMTKPDPDEEVGVAVIPLNAILDAAVAVPVLDSVVLDDPTCRTVSEPDVCRATTVVDEPDPTVMVEPGCRVCEPITSPLDAEAETAVSVALLTTTFDGVAGGASDKVDCFVPTCTIVWEPEVRTATTVVDEPEPRVILEPGCKV